MLSHEIGETAGHIWHTLEEEGPLRVSALQKQVDAAQPVLYMALGWLAREGKVVIETEGRSYRVSLR